MKRLAAISILFLLVMGSASVWADALLACCPEEHRAATMTGNDDCQQQPCCLMGAPLPTPQRGETGRLELAAAAATPYRATAAAFVTSVPADALAGVAFPPGASQTTPVLRC
jgi:hypothetical protein